MARLTDNETFAVRRIETFLRSLAEIEPNWTKQVESHLDDLRIIYKGTEWRKGAFDTEDMTEYGGIDHANQ